MSSDLIQYKSVTRFTVESSAGSQAGSISVHDYTLFKKGDLIQIFNAAAGEAFATRVLETPLSFEIKISPALPDTWNGLAHLAAGSEVFHGLPAAITAGGGLPPNAQFKTLKVGDDDVLGGGTNYIYMHEDTSDGLGAGAEPFMRIDSPLEPIVLGDESISDYQAGAVAAGDVIISGRAHINSSCTVLGQFYIQGERDAYLPDADAQTIDIRQNVTARPGWHFYPRAGNNVVAPWSDFYFFSGQPSTNSLPSINRVSFGEMAHIAGMFPNGIQYEFHNMDSGGNDLFLQLGDNTAATDYFPITSTGGPILMGWDFATWPAIAGSGNTDVLMPGAVRVGELYVHELMTADDFLVLRTDSGSGHYTIGPDLNTSTIRTMKFDASGILNEFEYGAAQGLAQGIQHTIFTERHTTAASASRILFGLPIGTRNDIPVRWTSKPLNFGASTIRGTTAADEMYITCSGGLRVQHDTNASFIESLYIRGPMDSNDRTRFYIYGRDDMGSLRFEQPTGATEFNMYYSQFTSTQDVDTFNFMQNDFPGRDSQIRHITVNDGNLETGANFNMKWHKRTDTLGYSDFYLGDGATAPLDSWNIRCTSTVGQCPIVIGKYVPSAAAEARVTDDSDIIVTNREDHEQDLMVAGDRVLAAVGTAQSQLVQYGSDVLDGTGLKTITFPRPFESAPLGFINYQQQVTGTPALPQVYTVTSTQMTAEGEPDTPFVWFAVGDGPVLTAGTPVATTVSDPDQPPPGTVYDPANDQYAPQEDLDTLP